MGAVFAPTMQVLLSKNFHSRPGCRQKSLVRNSGVGGGGQNSILSCCCCCCWGRQTVCAHRGGLWSYLMHQVTAKFCVACSLLTLSLLNKLVRIFVFTFLPDFPSDHRIFSSFAGEYQKHCTCWELEEKLARRNPRYLARKRLTRCRAVSIQFLQTRGLYDRRLFKGGGNGRGGIPHCRGRCNVCPQWCRDTRTVTRVRRHLLCWGMTKICATIA